jgi:tRNA 2-thiouridine synthesizing protein A
MAMSVSTGEQHLDCVGMACPVPIVRISRAMKAMAVGQRLRIAASDEAFPADLEAWLQGRADRLISLETANGNYMAVIEKCL